jgi:hypothetical protein
MSRILCGHTVLTFQGKLVETGQYLSFPRNVFTRPSSVLLGGRPNSRMADITDLLRGKSTSISRFVTPAWRFGQAELQLTEDRKRLPTASDSDTESPAKIPRLPSAVHAELARIPALKKPQKSKSDWVLPAVHTDHDLHGGPGWVDVSADKRDGLDDMISGLKNGSIPEETAIVRAAHCVRGLNRLTWQDDEEEGEEPEGMFSAPASSNRGDDSNPNWVADRFKCGQSHDGTATTGPNDWLAKKFDEMHDLYQGAQHKNSFQIRGYQKGSILSPSSVKRGRADDSCWCDATNDLADQER